jgi:histidinol-phosphatase
VQRPGERFGYGLVVLGQQHHAHTCQRRRATIATVSSDLAFALRIADAADAMTAARFRAHDLVVTRKPDRTPVTDADTAVEDMLRDMINKALPTDAIAGEEGGGAIGAGRTWVLDPIDGTKNFLRGVPAWATLIALVEDGTPTVGVVSAPALGKRWWAAAGEGAFSDDGRRLRVSAVSNLEDAYLSTTDLGSWVKYHSREAYLNLVDACWESRAFGDFWSHCLVAEGVMDVAAEPIVNPWDVAPIQVLVEEAGGRFTDWDGKPDVNRPDVVASNGRLHDEALRILKR